MTHVRLTAVILTGLALLPAIAAASDAPATQTALYRVTFDATWSQATHPTAFPPNPHFSGLIGGMHRDAASFWEPGQLASPGVENMAELGSKFPLNADVNNAIVAGSANLLLSGGGIGVSPGIRTLDFPVDREYPLVTLVSMLAPSPDWFVGVHGLSLLDDKGAWTEDLTVDLMVYDAGTDSGFSFTSPNSVTNPPQPISQITGFPFASGVPVGTFRFERRDSATPAFTAVGDGIAGATGVPSLSATGTLAASDPVVLQLSNALPSGTAVLIGGFSQADLPLLGGTLVPSPDIFIFGLPISAGGNLGIGGPWPAGIPSGIDVLFQYWIEDPTGPQGVAASNGVCAQTP